MTESFPLARTDATRMVAAALRRLQAEAGMTQRDVASKLGYKTSVVLSHVALGRVPVPIDKMAEFAEVLGIPPQRFLLAVLEQRFPHIDFRTLLGIRLPPRGRLVERLETIAGHDLDDLPPSTIHVLEEVVAASRPARRWLSIEELPVMELARNAFPKLEVRGLSEHERESLEACLRPLSREGSSR